jgi:hypothetical protein
MFRKVSLKTLTILFASLLLIVILVSLADHKKGNRSFKGNLIEYQPDQISKILVYPKVMQREKVELVKENDQWMLTANNKKFRADQNLIQSIINGLNGLTPESIVSGKKDRWKNYEVTDSLGTHVQLLSGEEVKADLVLGKVSYSAQGGKSYVRLTDDNTVYRINGSQASEVNRDINGFKDKTVISSSQSDWEKLTFSYPADSSFVLAKNGDKWEISGQPADSAEVARFLNAASRINHYQLARNDPQGTNHFRLFIEGSKLSSPIEILGYQNEDQFVLASSQNPGTYFEGKTLKEKLFPSQLKFIKKKK